MRNDGAAQNPAAVSPCSEIVDNPRLAQQVLHFLRRSAVERRHDLDGC
jgi:hypothetical protein